MAGTPTMISGARAVAGDQGVKSTGVKPDKDVNIAYLEPNSAPLLLLTKKLNKKKSINPTFSHFEDEPMPYWDAVNAGGGFTAGDLTITVDHGTFFAANYLVLVPNTAEIMRVTAVSTHDLTVERGVAGSSADVLVDNDDLRIIGTAYAAGASKGTMKSTKKTEVFGYTQIFRNTYGVTNTEKASEMYWGNDLAEERSTQGIDHAMQIESGFLFGKASVDTSGATPIWYTGGVVKAITTNTTAVGGFLDEDTLDEIIRNGFRYSSIKGKNLKWFFVSRLVASAINALARERLVTVPADQTYGIKTKEYQNINGTVSIIPHMLLENNPLSAGLNSEVYGGYGIGIDPDSPRYRYLQTRDTKLIRGIEAKGDDLTQEEYLSQVGLQFRKQEWCFLATGITG